MTRRGEWREWDAEGRSRSFQLGSMFQRALDTARRNPALVLLAASGAGSLLYLMTKNRRTYPYSAEAEDIPILNTGQARIYDPDVSPRYAMHDSVESRREMSARI